MAQRQPTLIVFSDAELDAGLSKTARERIWASFMDGGTAHSACATTLPYIIRRCEREGVPFTLNAHPGIGYWIEPIKE